MLESVSKYAKEITKVAQLEGYFILISEQLIYQYVTYIRRWKRSETLSFP
ncbi:uncharacterized protein METZ01_LOCUS226839 [marine metagenome]|uniref:Uncharacterized protein n=1 Tax=marine metagenome TaxID=408172 RepID=A0A382GGU6_9ZZZZ